MKIDYIYFSEDDKSASAKNSLKTCEALADYAEVTLHSNLQNFQELDQGYDIKNNIHYSKHSKQPSNLFSEAFYRTLFVLNTLVDTKHNKSKLYTRDIYFLFFLSLPLIEKLIQKPVIYECHNLYDYTWKFPRFMEYRAIQRADKILCVSNGVLEGLKSNFGVENSKMVLQRNCVDLKKFKRTSVKYENILPKKGFNIVYAGSDKECKGVEVLIKAYNRLDQQVFNLVLAGSIKQNKEDEGIKISGWLEEDKLIKVLKNADLLVVPSKNSFYQRNYTCPMKLLEYMASQTEILASDLPTTREISEDAVTYFEPDNVKDLAGKIKSIKNSEVYEGDIIQAYRIVQKNYTWESKAKKVLTIFKAI